MHGLDRFGRYEVSNQRSEALDEDAWPPIPYWLSTPEASGADVADVAETTYTAFTGTGTDAIDVRLIVRRVRPTPGS